MLRHITLSNGFKLKIDDAISEDYDYMDAYLTAQDENEEDAVRLRASMKMVDLVFGAYKNALFAKIKKDNNGRLKDLPFTYAGEAIEKLSAISAAAKNS